MNEHNNTTMEQQKREIKLEVRTKPAHSERNPSLMGYATVKIGDVMFIKNIQIVQGEHGPFVSMPSVKNKEGKFQQVCFPSKEFRPGFNYAVLSTFSKTEEAYQKFCPEAGRANFEVKITPYDKDNIKGFAQIRIPDVMYFNSISIRENMNGNLWASMPGYSYTNAEGEKAYHSFFEPVQKSESLIYGSMINAYKEAASKLTLIEFQQKLKEVMPEKEIVKDNVRIEEKKSKTERETQQEDELEQINILSEKYPTRANEGIEI